MRKATWLAGTLTAAALAGCQGNTSTGPTALKPMTMPVAPPPASQAAVAPPPAAPGSQDVVATVGTVKINRAELDRPLMEAYGFNTLMLIVQRDMAKQACTEAGMTVSPGDIDSEWKWTLDRMFPNDQGEDRQKLLDQYLAQPKPPGQMSTRTEFDIVIETNAYLRKLAQPTMSKAITDDVLQQAFDEQYGAQVRVRHIALSNPQAALKYRAAIEDGQDFATLARHVSLNEDTARVGGELPPFTMNSARFPKAFKEAAFALKVGEISEPVAADGAYHLIKLEQKIAPKAVKFADVKDSIREDIQQQAVLEAVKAVRGKLAQEALEQMKITDPVLKVEFDKRLGVRDTLIKDRDKIRQQMDKERAGATTLPAVPPVAATPVAVPAPVKTTQPAAPSTQPAKSAPVPPIAPPASSSPTTRPATSPAAATSAPAPAPSPHGAAAPPSTRPATRP